MSFRSVTGDAGTLIVGAGYVGGHVADRLRQADPTGPIYTVTRSRPNAARLAARGMTPLIADWTDRRTLAQLPRCQRVLVAVSYDPRSGKSREDSQVGGLSHLLDFVDPAADLVYLSTTGVFHQTGGEWVDENSPTRPIGVGGIAHLRAEELLHRRRPHGRWAILRLAGIYGPGRIPRARDVLRGAPIEGPNEGYLNLIHRDDAARAVIAAWEKAERSRRLYLVSDDSPVLRRAFYGQVARCLKVPSPTFAPGASTSLSARSMSHKRIWNRRLRHELLPRMLYPDYVQGLTAILKSDTL